MRRFLKIFAVLTVIVFVIYFVVTDISNHLYGPPDMTPEKPLEDTYDTTEVVAESCNFDQAQYSECLLRWSVETPLSNKELYCTSNWLLEQDDQGPGVKAFAWLMLYEYGVKIDSWKHRTIGSIGVWLMIKNYNFADDDLKLLKTRKEKIDALK